MVEWLWAVKYQADIRNVTIRSCLMDNENWSPLRFKSQPSRGGTVENITFEDIIIKGARSIFDINMEWRMVPPLSCTLSTDLFAQYPFQEYKWRSTISRNHVWF